MKVYLFGNSDYVKIGITEDVGSRAKTLDSPMLPFSVSVLSEYEANTSAHAIEKALHKHFKEKHLRGEWFTFINPSEFTDKAREFHEAVLSGKNLFEKTPDLDRVWVEEWAFGQRMLEFISRLETKNAQASASC